MQREAEDAYAIIGDLDFALKAFQVRGNKGNGRERERMSFLGSPWVR